MKKTKLLISTMSPKSKTEGFMRMSNLLVCILLAGFALSSQAGHTQTITGQTVGLENTPNGKTVKAWYTAWQKGDWNLMTQILADGFTFTSPLDDHLKLDVFNKRCWLPNAGKIKSVDVQELIMNGDAIFVIGNGYNQDGKLLRNCDYFKLKKGKIISYECFFGPGINYPTNSRKQ